MAISTFSSGVRLVNDAASRSVPHVLPERHVFTQHDFPFISDFFNVDDPNLGPEQQAFQMAPRGKIKGMVTHQLQPKLYDFGSLPTQFTTNGTATGLSAGSTGTISVTDASGLKKYHALKNRRSGAVILVSSVSSNTITFYPLVGGTAGTGVDNINSGDKYDLIGAMYPDGATLQTAYTNEPTERSNYLQFHVNECELGLLASKRKLFPDATNSKQTDAMTQAIQHNEGRERAFLFGVERSPTTVNSETIHGMKGLEGWLSTEWDVGGTVTLDEWRTVIMPVVAAAGGGGTLKAVTGNTVLSVFTGLLEDKLQVQMNENMLGMKFVKVRSPLGDVEMRGSQPMTEREGEALIYRPELMTRMYLEGLDMVFMEDLAPNNILKETNAWMTCETLLVHNPESIVKLTNILG